MRKKNTIKIFWSRVNKTSSCWNWNSTMFSNGYGQFRFNDKNMQAHRLAYTSTVGDVPEGKQLDHLCRNRRCVNPAHLEPVTVKENVLRGEGITARYAKARYCKNGHKFDIENTFYYKRPGGMNRRCITCNRKDTKGRRARLKALSVV